jgi:hypothetical protein
MVKYFDFDYFVEFLKFFWNYLSYFGVFTKLKKPTSPTKLTRPEPLLTCLDLWTRSTYDPRMNRTRLPKKLVLTQLI